MRASKKKRKYDIVATAPYLKERLPDKTCLVLVSVGKVNHEGDQFHATMQYVKSIFGDNYHVKIADTLQRHNLAREKNTRCDQQYETAAKLGQEWFSNNNRSFCLDSERNGSEYSFWSSDLEDENFNDLLSEMSNLYATDNAFKSAIDSTVSEYIERLLKRNESIPENTREHCHNYLIEECAAMRHWMQYDFLVYPGKISTALEAAREYHIKKLGLSKNALEWKVIRFKKIRKQNDSSKVHQKELTSCLLMNFGLSFGDTKLTREEDQIKMQICMFTMQALSASGLPQERKDVLKSSIADSILKLDLLMWNSNHPEIPATNGNGAYHRSSLHN